MRDTMEQIKIVIWDLDETFWQGTLSEEGVTPIPENIDLVKQLTDRGIINSIASKNDFEAAKAKLVELGIWDYFVFPQIAWSPKGAMIKTILAKAALRDVNALFLDDNHINLKEASFYCPGLHVQFPEFISEIASHSALVGKDDASHSRLKQYRILEEKDEDRKSFENNEEFLRHSDIRVEFIEDLDGHVERISELIQRTNQLNYTKQRISSAEVAELVHAPGYKIGAIRVLDAYGDYGVTGFYALSEADHRLEHFLFSCRTLNLGVEQYVYAKLGFPAISVSGDVATSLERTGCPSWINALSPGSVQRKGISARPRTILLRGGCDFEQMLHYLNYTGLQIEREFNYVSADNVMIHREHTAYLRLVKELPGSTLEEIASTVAFLDDRAFETKVFDEDYDILAYSLLMDYTQRVYVHKRIPGVRVAFGGTPSIFDDIEGTASRYEARGMSTLGIAFWKQFREDYNDTGPIQPDEFVANLAFIRESVSKPIIFINGSEVQSPAERSGVEPNARQRHIEMNRALASFIEQHDDCYLLDVRTAVTDESCITDNLRHYTRPVYPKLAESLSILVSDILGKELKYSILKATIKAIIASLSRAKSYVRKLLRFGR